MEDEIYKENILDRYRNPRWKKVIEDANIREGGVNPSCGDALIFFVKFGDNGSVEEASFDGEGCAISQSSADILAENIESKSREEILSIDEKYVYNLLGVQVGIAREKCATLALNALRQGLKK